MLNTKENRDQFKALREHAVGVELSESPSDPSGTFARSSFLDKRSFLLSIANLRNQFQFRVPLTEFLTMSLTKKPFGVSPTPFNWSFSAHSYSFENDLNRAYFVPIFRIGIEHSPLFPLPLEDAPKSLPLIEYRRYVSCTLFGSLREFYRPFRSTAKLFSNKSLDLRGKPFYLYQLAASFQLYENWSCADI